MPLDIVAGSLTSPLRLLLHAGDSPWSFRFHPEIWLNIVLMLGAYLFAITKLGPKYAPRGQPPATPRHFLLFTLGIFTLWAAIDGPIHTLSDGYLYSVHMAQHLVLTFIVPPLVLMGMPAWLLRLLLKPRPVMAVARRLLRPIPGLVLFNGVIIISHLPAVVNLTLEHEVAHFSAHALLFASAVVMWWPVLSPLEELPRVSYPVQMLYLFGQSLIPTVPASFLTFSTRPLYSFYEGVPRLGGISVITDQRIAGLVMKIAGGFLLWAVITVLFFKWYAQEESREDQNLQWEDVERELEEMGLTRR